jgi:uncharacterized protein YhfF
MPPPDWAALAVFVQDFTEATGLGVTWKHLCFGDSPELADELAALIRSGRKRATAAMIAEFEHEGEPLSTIGRFSVVWPQRDAAEVLAAREMLWRGHDR